MLVVKVLQQTRRTPSTTKDNDRLFTGIERLLSSRMSFLISDVVESASGE